MIQQLWKPHMKSLVEVARKLKFPFWNIFYATTILIKIQNKGDRNQSSLEILPGSHPHWIVLLKLLQMKIEILLCSTKPV